MSHFSAPRTRIAIVHPAIPKYRVAFFEKLIPEAKRQGIDIDVYVGEVAPEIMGRSDTTFPAYATTLRTRIIGIRGRHLIYRSPWPILRGKYDLVVLEQAVRNIESYILKALMGPSRVAYWGHGKTYTLPVSRLQERVKTWLTLRSSWFFAYTSGGAVELRARGYPEDRITVLNNTIDASALRELLQEVSPGAVREFSARFDLRDNTALFVGGLDNSKRLDFLIEAAEIIAGRVRGFRLLIVGDGPLAASVEQASRTRAWLKPVGPLFGLDKATALACGKIFLMPGRVGLVAIDSFVAGIPIVTTDWAWHAPEFEYLEDGTNAIVVKDAIQNYADAASLVLTDEELRTELALGATLSSEEFTIDAMVSNFLNGLVRWRRVRREKKCGRLQEIAGSEPPHAR